MKDVNGRPLAEGRWVPIAQAAADLGVCARTLRRMIAGGVIALAQRRVPGSGPGGVRTVVDRDAVLAYRRCKERAAMARVKREFRD